MAGHEARGGCAQESSIVSKRGLHDNRTARYERL
jgi:hypothetical protein